MKILELFCGLGGWSKGFAELGHECIGIDINDYGYPYRFIKADLLDWEPDQEYDIVLSSPPCSEFSIVKKIQNKHIWVERTGLDLVWRSFHLIEKIKPKYWVIENVKGLAEFIGEPNEKVRYARHKGRKEAWLWGNFGKLPMLDSMIEFNVNWQDPGWEQKKNPTRGLIPLPLSRAMAKQMLKDITVKT